MTSLLLVITLFVLFSAQPSYNIKAKSARARVCVAAGEEIDTDIFTMHLLTP